MFGGQRRWMKSERIKIMSELWSLFPAPVNIAWTIPESLASVDWQAFFAQLLCPKSPVFSMFFLNKFLFFLSQLSTREFIFRCRSRSALTTSMTWTFKKNDAEDSSWKRIAITSYHLTSLLDLSLREFQEKCSKFSTKGLIMMHQMIIYIRGNIFRDHFSS